MGFRKAKAEQAAIKMGIYGASGSGKTFTTLLCAEGLAKLTKKRIAFVDTERGTDFYCKDVAARTVHPKAFDFDAMYTRSITEVLDAVSGLNFNEHGVIVLDSITHLWEATKAAYTGKLMKNGGIPMHAWGKLKKPYKDLMTLLLSCQQHVFILGRQGNEYAEDETGETKSVGTKMKAEGETPYEPHILIHMEAVKSLKSDLAVVTAFAEKDRTGTLHGRTIEWPKYENLIAPIIPLLGGTQAKVLTDEETAAVDGEAIADADAAKQKFSSESLRKFKARLELCDTQSDVDKLANEISADVKKKMVASHVTELRDLFKNWKPGQSSNVSVVRSDDDDMPDEVRYS